jgi:hypothetical protein
LVVEESEAPSKPRSKHIEGHFWYDSEKMMGSLRKSKLDPEA